MKFCRVCWWDTISLSGWREANDYKRFPNGMAVESIGYLVKRGKRVVVIVQSLCANGDFGEPLVIPTGTIKSIEILGEVNFRDN